MSATKVLHIINGEFYSGAERVQDILGERLPEFGFDCSFICLKPGLFHNKRSNTSAKIYDAHMRSRFDIDVVNKIENVIQREKYSLIHTHTPRAALIGRITSTRSKIPFVHHIHSPAQRDTESYLRNFFNSKIENWSLKRASRLIAVSHSMAAHMEKVGFSSSSITVVPNGVPVLLEESPWTPPKGKWVIGTVALFRPRKGLEILIRAVAELRRMGIEIEVRAVGGFESEEYRLAMLNLVNELEVTSCFVWTGFTSNVCNELSRMDAFVLPSLFGEGLPMVILEAMSYGLPIIGTNVEGIPELLNNGCGILINPGSSMDLAKGILALVEMDESNALSLSRRAHSRQRYLYSDFKMASSVAEIYKTTIETAR